MGDVEPTDSTAGQPVWKWSSLMDRDVHPTWPRARPPLHPPSFIFVTACFLLCTATGRLFVKVIAGVRSQAVFQRNSELLKEPWHWSWDVSCLQSVAAKKHSILTSYSIIFFSPKMLFLHQKVQTKVNWWQFFCEVSYSQFLYKPELKRFHHLTRKYLF